MGAKFGCRVWVEDLGSGPRVLHGSLSSFRVSALTGFRVVGPGVRG